MANGIRARWARRGWGCAVRWMVEVFRARRPKRQAGRLRSPGMVGVPFSCPGVRGRVPDRAGFGFSAAFPRFGESFPDITERLLHIWQSFLYFGKRFPW